jgi:hypothetical protein
MHKGTTNAPPEQIPEVMQSLDELAREGCDGGKCLSARKPVWLRRARGIQGPEITRLIPGLASYVPTPIPWNEAIHRNQPANGCPGRKTCLLRDQLVSPDSPKGLPILSSGCSSGRHFRPPQVVRAG